MKPMSNCTCMALVKSGQQKINFSFLSQNICCGYSKEPSQRDGSFEHPEHMFKRMGKKIFTILRSKFCYFVHFMQLSIVQCNLRNMFGFLKGNSNIECSRP